MLMIDMNDYIANVLSGTPNLTFYKIFSFGKCIWAIKFRFWLFKTFYFYKQISLVTFQ